jgi:hypothetical protein
MSKEKQIEKISKILTDAAHKACEDIPFAQLNDYDLCTRPTMECHRCKEARALIAAGYRKQSENMVEVVRCKDCKHCTLTEDGEYNPEDIVCGYFMTDGMQAYDYCSYGERKE